MLRLRDARFMRRIRNGTVPNVPMLKSRPDSWFLARELATRPQNSNRRADSSGLSAGVQLLEHYFSGAGADRRVTDSCAGVRK